MRRTVDDWIEAYLRFQRARQHVAPSEIDAWRLPLRERERINALSPSRSDRNHPSSTVRRDAGARQRATRALAQLRNAGDRLNEAHRVAGVSRPPKVGENVAAQRIVARRDPPAALQWVNAEIDYLRHLEIAIKADQTANVINVPRGFSPAADEARLKELNRRLTVLESMAQDIEDCPLMRARRQDALAYSRLEAIVEDLARRVDETDRLKNRRQDQETRRARMMALVADTPALQLAHHLVGPSDAPALIDQLVATQA